MVLGAGFDTRCYGAKELIAIRTGKAKRVYEVDKLATQRAKQALLSSIPTLIVELCSCVYVYFFPIFL